MLFRSNEEDRLNTIRDMMSVLKYEEHLIYERTKYVDISTWFKNTYSLNVSTDVNTKIATATMKVDSAEKNQYDIQFYRTNGINGAEQWSDGNHTNITVNGTGFVSMSFTQSATKEN